MKARGFYILIVFGVLWFAQWAWAQGEGMIFENPHARYVKSYKDTSTCLACHEKEAKDVFQSIHYQWKADAPNIVNSRGRKLGKINTINDFCTNPSISWIAILKNSRGEIIGQGCSKCHAGLGLKPTENMTREQLENIDCLVCHSYNYRREVYKTEDGTLRRRPKAWNKPEVLLNIAQSVRRPATEMCLRCHVGSGGGLNYKRGDLETYHLRADRDFDVHIGSGMTCTQCHKFKNHRVLGSGTQLAGQDRPGENVRCENCHKGRLHSDETLNQHMNTVYCTTCHIPTFAKHEATDMHRDWSKREYLKEHDKYEPKIKFKKNVRPVYTWWNGKGILTTTEPVKEVKGRVKLYEPQGSIDDPNSRIYAFKLHTAKLPVDKDTRQLIPIKVGIVFKKGDNDAAVKAGAKAFYGKEKVRYGWVITERYMGIFHEVVPAKNALKCIDCHMEGDRLDWEALGYKGDPIRYGGRK